MSRIATNKTKVAISNVILLAVGLNPTSASGEPATAPECMVATVHPTATDVAVGVMRDGGNAVDAAVAAALMLGVVDGHNSGLGGGCLMLIRRADGQLIAIDGRETAPAAAHRDMYVRDGQAVAELSRTGPLAVAVPGALAAYAMAVESHGKQTLAELLQPAAAVAEGGFTVSPALARAIARTAPELAKFDGSRTALLKSDGTPYEEGDTLRRPDLAKSYRAIGEHGTDWFYRGSFAQNVADWMAEHGGLLTKEDFAAYRPKQRAPVVSTYRDHTIVGFPPPSSGGTHVAQILNVLENFKLREIQRRNPYHASHLIIEAMKRAFADRAHWLGDADFANVPRGLLNKSYAASLADQIDPQRATPVPSHGQPPDWQSLHFGKHTTHIATVDAYGNWVALTATVNTSFGSKVIVPGTGIVLNNEMDDFSSQPGVPNAFGLIGAENNAIEPGKRPLSSMSPTIVLNARREPVLTLGAAGGPKIITQVVLAIVRHLDYQMALTEALGAPRYHHQWRPDELAVEEAFPNEGVNALAELGHKKVRVLTSGGVTQAIARTTDGQLLGVHDPRVPGKAAGF